MPSDWNARVAGNIAQHLDNDRVFTVADLAIAGATLEVVVTPAADEIVTIRGIFLGQTAGTGAFTLLVTGAAVLFHAAPTLATDLELLIPISGEAVGQALTINATAATTLTDGFLTVSYSLTKVIVA